MAGQWPDALYADGTLDVAEACGVPEFGSSIPSSTDNDFFVQPFMQLLKDFLPLALNTAHFDADFTDWVLVKEGTKQHAGGGMVKWNRTYAIVPDSWDDWEIYGYPFIGYQGIYLAGNIGNVNPVAVTGRPRETQKVDSRVHRDYFLVGPGLTYETAGEIPILIGQQYYAGGLGGQKTDYIMDAFGGTSPTRTAYEVWVANADSNAWTGDWVGAVSPVNPSQLLAENSTLTRLHGNIWVRASRFVLAQ